MAERIQYMANFLRNLVVVVVPIVLRLVATQIEELFEKGANMDES